jgi:hypothetical protein
MKKMNFQLKEKLRHDTVRFGLVIILFFVVSLAFMFVRYAERGNTDDPAIRQGDVVAYVGEGNLYRAYFKEPFESALVFYRDGTVFSFTTHDSYIINIPPEYVYDYLVKQKNKPINEVLFIVHNHDRPASFSTGDKDFYHYMKAKGFNGYFIIYYTFSGRIKILEEGE